MSNDPPESGDLDEMTIKRDVAEDSTVWLVSFDDDDDREMKAPDIAEALSRGEIDGETIVWRDGLADWISIAEVPALANLMPSGGQTAATGGFLGTGINLVADKKMPLPGGAKPAQPQRKSEPPPFPGKASRKSEPPPFPGKASRKSEPPPLPGREEEPVASASLDELEAEEAAPISIEPESIDPDSLKALQAPDASPRMARAQALSGGTFSLDGPSKQAAGEEAEPPTLRRSEAPEPPTERIDAPKPKLKPKPKASDDDVLGLSGGNAGGGDALLAPPSIDLSTIGTGIVDDDKSGDQPAEPRIADRQTEPPKSQTAAKKKASDEEKASPLPIILGVAFLGVVVWLFMPKEKPTAEQPTAEPATAPAPEPAPTPPPTAEPAQLAAPPTTGIPTTPEPSAAAAPQAPATTTAQQAAAPQTAAPQPAPPTPSPAPAATSQTATSPQAAATAAAPPSGDEKPTEQKPADEKPAGEEPKDDTTKTDEEPQEEVQLAGPFDSAAAQASSCRKPGDPTGRASVVVTFAPSGRATRATISGPPFAGTATGGCIASTMRKARVPPFAGDRVTVSKTVVIN